MIVSSDLQGRGGNMQAKMHVQESVSFEGRTMSSLIIVLKDFLLQMTVMWLIFSRETRAWEERAVLFAGLLQQV